MNLKNYSNMKKTFFFIIFFLISILSCFIILLLERKVLGINSTYHPDSAHYLNRNINILHSYLSFELGYFENFLNFFINIFNGTLYYSLINLMYELENIFKNIIYFNPYRNLLKLNIFIYAITNLIILNNFFKINKNFSFKILISIIIFCLLPYKIHLAVNILKETLIFFFLVTSVIYSNIYVITLSFIFGTSLRSLFIFYFLNILDFKNLIVKKNLLILIMFILVFFIVMDGFFSLSNFFESFSKFIYERNIADMGGRDYDKIPNFSEYGYIGILMRIILWPFFFLTGTFIIFSDSIFFKFLGIEIIALQILSFYCKKKFLFNAGLILFLIILSLYVNSFTAFFRYGYLAIQIVFLKNLLKN